MKKRLSMLLAALAMMATGVASLGCPWWFNNEPETLELFDD